MEYHAFASYSTDPDYRPVRKTKNFLESFHTQVGSDARRKLAELRVCVDGIDFKRRRVNESERGEPIMALVDEYLRQSQYLIVFCSHRASKSGSWVDKEVDRFIEIHDGETKNVLLAVTEGADPANEPEDVFPPSVRSAGLHRHVWYDLRGARGRGAKRWSRVRDLKEEWARLAADLNGVSAGEVLPAWQQQQRLVKRRRWTTIGVMALLLLIASGIVYNEFLRRDAASQAVSVLSAIGDQERMSRNELTELQKLSANSVRVRRAFFEEAVSSDSRARRLESRAVMATRAAIGLDRDLRRHVIHGILLPELQSPSTSSDVRDMCTAVGATLQADQPEFAASIILQSLSEMLSTNREGCLQVLDKRVRAAVPHLDSTDATLILRHWIELRLSRRGLSFPRLFVYAALDAVAGRLDSTERANRITEVIRSMVDTEVHDKRMKLAATLRALMVTSATSTSHPVDEVIAAMKSASAAPVHIAGMGEAIAAAAQPSSAQLIEAFGIVCEAVERDDSNANLLLSHDLESLSKAIESSSLPSAGETLARMLHEVDDTVTARTLVPALKIIATNAPENSQLVLLDSVIESIRRTRDYTTQIALAECGRAITQHLNAVGAEKAGKRIVGAVRQLDSVSRQQRLVELEALAILLSGLSDRPAAWNSDDVRQVFRTALGETLNAWEIRSLAYSIMPLKRQLAPEFANEVNQLIGDAVNRTSDSTQLLWLAQAFNVLPQPIERRNRQGVANVIVERMQRESNPNQLSTLAKALGLVVSSEESLQAAQAATVLLDAIEQRVSGSHIDVMNLAGGLQSIEAALDSQSSDRVANRLLSLIGVSTRPETLRILIDCLLAVPTSVSQSDGTFAFLRLIASLEQTIDAASFWSPRGFDDISRSLELIPADIDGQQLIDILKRPNWTGVLETAIINRIESLAGRPIDGSLWDAVDWAVEKDLDVTGPPSKWSDHKDGRLRNIRHNKPLHTEPRAARVSEFNTVRRGPVNGGVSRLMRPTHVHVACTAR